MAKLRLTVGRGHVEELARLRHPVGAVEELIWNSLDADAENVTVLLERNDIGGVDRVAVIDDGTGIPAEKCAERFEQIGTSWKKRAQVSEVKKRVLHGKNGRGRVRAFALGSEVRWSSVSEAPGGRRRVVIESDRGSMDEFDVSDAEPTAEATGTVFEAFGGEDLQKLTEDTARTALTAAFALHLEAYPDIRIFFDGRQLDPASEQLRVDAYEVAARPESPRPPARLKIIEWSRPCSRALILCDERQMSLAHLKPEIQAPGFHFTAYLSWPGFEDDSIGDLSFADWTPDGPTAEVLAEARDRLRAHFRSRADERRRELVDSWRAEGFYPYAGEPVNDRERAERETFDAVATAVIRHLPASKRAQKVSFALLRSVLTHEPGDVLRIAEELFALSKQEQAELSRLLDRTPLSSLIKASTATTGRLDFLSALEHLVFAPVARARARVKERTELHRVLENECWVFGEEYGLHVSDRSLNEVLRQHCRLLDREAPVPGPVLREDGSRGIVDLMLSRAARHRKGERHHLVVELKRPSLTLGMTEFAQINSYAQAVMNDDRFRDPTVTWDFWLVGNAMDDGLRQVAHQPDRMPGCAITHPSYRIWVRTWGEIIEDTQERLRFYSEQLEYQSSTEHAMDYLIRAHGDTVADLANDGTLPAPRTENTAPQSLGGTTDSRTAH
ncbi:Histidine kinase-, DNA gyrase B-, and HSP90-like ATPase [Streptomyces sp. TverLS-915]|uniref:ATP-binding protein n=1 Tax=Streptomyces sp. TverLS-915 TaxID=1839763 RepID=UPI00081E915E|nr:ATP-binding protein [Streptomyces sp. TverLS-915]SCE01452.1 Histidine kinase-, DNA gyrase B-, and HSP90-like ATPase [Streptomyces sp. TverLS-915]